MRWLRRRSTSRGEGSVTDLLRDYRICNYNDEHHGGPHIHFPITGPPVRGIDITEAEAEDVMRRYGEEHDAFEIQRYLEFVTQWRSESRKR